MSRARQLSILLVAAAAASCAEVRLPTEEGGGDSVTQAGPSTGTGGIDSNGGAPGGGAQEGGSGGSGKAPVPPVPPCFPDAIDGLADPTVSESKWLASNVVFERGTAVLGQSNEDLALLRHSATLPEACFLSFRLDATSRGDSELDAFVLLRPDFADIEEFTDLDIYVGDTQVQLYVRPEPYTDTQPRTGDHFLLVLSGAQATLYQTNADATAWAYVNTLRMPFPLTGTELAFVRYDTLAPFWVDDVSSLPDNLIAAFPPVP